jgi:hypothetical protein
MITVALILLVATLLVLFAAIGVVSIVVAIDDRRGSRSRTLTDRTLARAEATTRRILGVGAHNANEGDQ